MSDERLTKLVGWFENAEDASQDARTLSERDRDYYDGKQWTDDEIATLQTRKQPIVTRNRIKPKVDALCGLERAQRTDPKAWPRNPSDEAEATAAAKSLRFVADNVKFDRLRSRAWKDLLVEGIAAVIFSIKVLKNGKKEIVCARIAWDRFFYDPASSDEDFEDALYLGEVLWMDYEDAKIRYKAAEKALIDTMNSAPTGDDTYEDKPKFNQWADRNRKRIRIVRMFYREGDQWREALFTQSGVIKDKELIFTDENGESFHPVVARSAFVDRDNNRYGMMRQSISPQDEVNKRGSKLLHHLSVRQIRIDPSAKHRAAKIRAELKKPDGVIEAEAGDFEILDQSDFTVGQAQLLQEAKDEIDATGVNPTLQGKAEGGLSGRAIQAQQQAGMLELGPMLEGRQSFNERCYRIMWNLIRQFWTEERWVRVTDAQGKPEFVGLNRPLTNRELLEREFGEVPPEVDLMPNADNPAIVNGQPVLENRLAELDIDIIVEDGVDVSTLQGEQFDALVSSGVLNALVAVDPRLVVELMPNLPDKQRILDLLEGGDNENAQAQAQLGQAVQQLELAKADADVKETASKAALNMAKAQKEAITV